MGQILFYQSSIAMDATEVSAEKKVGNDRYQAIEDEYRSTTSTFTRNRFFFNNAIDILETL